MPQELNTNLTPSDLTSPQNEMQFIMRSLLGDVRTSMPVKVTKVTNTGNVAEIGRVDIVPLVGQLDGDGQLIPHGAIYDVPYLRLQCGGNAIIIDPVVGDIGIALFCDRDISVVKASKAGAHPGSLRRHDMSDAVYLGAILSSAPTQYIRFSASGIDIAAQTINIIGNTYITGSETVSNTLTVAGKSINAHTHGGVLPGGGTSGGMS
jgi:hypothetical protein